RLHLTGPEFEGWLSNHGPMAAEAMVRSGHADQVHRWVDRYQRRLDEMPDPDRRIGPSWREALGDPRRIRDWIEFFTRELDDDPWREVLARWWPRLLPGIAAGATHGVIRVGHAVRVLLEEQTQPKIIELAHGMGYWAARWQPVPGVVQPTGNAGADTALAGVPRIDDQTGGITSRIARLPGLPGWPEALAALRAPVEPADARTLLTELVDAAVLRYRGHGHGSPVMLVHSATAPNAVLRVLPALPTELWVRSLAAAWAASATVTSVYAPADAAPESVLPVAANGAQEVLARAVEHGDEHVIKFADTAVDTFGRTGDPAALSAALRACHMISPA
ncbi:MAG: DUF4243 domain-containing protein, partial [Kutzneria sp.]|nr:DUF4243 domain-containing protein [Kutzneria sp.]